MVKSTQTNAYECEVCGNRFFERDIAEKHEKSPEKPRFKINEEVKGYYPISKVNGNRYVATTFRVLEFKKVKHSFDYLLELLFVEQYHRGFYSSPCFSKGNSLNRSNNWIAFSEEEKNIIKSLEGKLNEKIVISEKQLSHQIYYK